MDAAAACEGQGQWFNSIQGYSFLFSILFANFIIFLFSNLMVYYSQDF
jgi:hypothetical protein